MTRLTVTRWTSLPMMNREFTNDLLHELQARWNTASGQQQFELPPEKALRQILDACYHASLRTEEHRPTRCVLVYAPIEKVPDRALLLFEQPVEFSELQLVRLAPVADFQRTLIGCYEFDGQVRIWGLFEHGNAWAQYSAGDPPGTPVEPFDVPPDCLAVSIEEPGAISIARGPREIVRLRGGAVLPASENPLRQPEEPLGRFFEQLVNEIVATPEHQDLRTPAAQECCHRSMFDLYTTSVAGILDRIRLRRHGGSLVVSRLGIPEAHARVKYRVSRHPGLARDLVDYFRALCELARIPEQPSGDGERLARCASEQRLSSASQQLIRGMNQVSLLAAADGAVLLDGSLRIEGFGVRFPVLLPPEATITDAATGVQYACDDWGLRHQSVFSVCRETEDAVGLIVSQDGGIKAVKNVAGGLWFWRDILD